MRRLAQIAAAVLSASLAGCVTGAGSADPAAIAGQVAMVKRESGLPVCVRFGGKSGAQAAEMAKIADGVVVGSAFVEKAGDAHATGRFKAAAPAMGSATALSSVDKRIRLAASCAKSGVNCSTAR